MHTKLRYLSVKTISSPYSLQDQRQITCLTINVHRCLANHPHVRHKEPAQIPLYLQKQHRARDRHEHHDRSRKEGGRAYASGAHGLHAHIIGGPDGRPIAGIARDIILGKAVERACVVWADVQRDNSAIAGHLEVAFRINAAPGAELLAIQAGACKENRKQLGCVRIFADDWVLIPCLLRPLATI